MNDPSETVAIQRRDETTLKGSAGAQPIKIRRATSNDLDIIINIWSDGAQSGFGQAVPGPESVVEFFRDHLQRETEPFGYWIAEVAGQVVGWQSLLRTRPNPISQWAHSSTYVSSHNRAKGVGRSLLAFATAHAKESGISHIEGFVLASNIATTRIIESLRWQRLGVVPGDNREEALWVYVPNHD
jgi:L-amino acid N-acyltransferase YncA